LTTRSVVTESGPFFEDLRVGQKIVHKTGRTITDSDNIWFTLLTCNPNQIHFNRDYTEKNYSSPPFNGNLVVNSALTYSVVLGLTVADTSINGFMLGLQNMKMPNPVFAGDTLYAESEITSVRKSESHETMGIVSMRTKGVNQKRETVIEFERTFMIPLRGRTWK
jgi:acyl dehydratase